MRDVLTDTALHFLTPGSLLPANPRMYLIAAFRNKLFNRRRESARREKALGGALIEAALDSEYARNGDVAAGCSEAAVRESRGPGWERAALPGALERLSAHLGGALTPEERVLLVAVAEDVPQREVAEWLGVSHAVARKRLERLRVRMTEVAARYSSSLPPDEARELQGFLRRCRARIGVTTQRGTPSLQRPNREPGEAGETAARGQAGVTPESVKPGDDPRTMMSNRGKHDDPSRG